MSDLGDMSEENSFSLEEYSLSRDSIFSLDEYSPEFSTHASEVEISPYRSFSVEEYTSTSVKQLNIHPLPLLIHWIRPLIQPKKHLALQVQCILRELIVKYVAPGMTL